MTTQHHHVITKLLVSAAIALGSTVGLAAPAGADTNPIGTCVSITDPAAHRACTDKSLRDELHRYQGNCEASPLYGQVGQLCRDSWVRKSAPPNQSPSVFKAVLALTHTS
jgi:hypothetical protein